MDILDRITALLDGRDQKVLTEYLGLKNVAFSEWKSGKSKSFRKYLIEIANFFDVSLDYLVYGKEGIETATDDVNELLRYYSTLSDIDKGKVIEKAETLAELAAERAAEQARKTAKSDEVAADGRLAAEEPEQKQLDENTEDFYIDLCSLPASAGSGVQLDESRAEPMRIAHTSTAERANYAVRVVGDSMEPAYYDGDIVLIKTCPAVEIGEIGLFSVNDTGYIKKRGKDCLISLNPARPNVNIELGDVVRCWGKVLGKAEIIR